MYHEDGRGGGGKVRKVARPQEGLELALEGCSHLHPLSTVLDSTLLSASLFSLALWTGIWLSPPAHVVDQGCPRPGSIRVKSGVRPTAGCDCFRLNSTFL